MLVPFCAMCLNCSTRKMYKRIDLDLDRWDGLFTLAIDTQ